MLRPLTQTLIATAEFRQQAEHFEIQPDQGDHEREGAVPLHVFGSAHTCAGFDEVEVEDEVERGDDNDNEAEADADWAGAVDGSEVHAEEAEDEFEQVKDCDAS